MQLFVVPHILPGPSGRVKLTPKAKAAEIAAAKEVLALFVPHHDCLLTFP